MGGVLEWLATGLGMEMAGRINPQASGYFFPSKGTALLTRQLPGEDSTGQTTPKLGFQQLAAPTQQASQEPPSLCSPWDSACICARRIKHIPPGLLKQNLPQWPREIRKESSSRCVQERPQPAHPPASSSTIRVFSLARSKFRLKEVWHEQPERLCPR